MALSVCFYILGDIIPDHPHMLILMFPLVIIGLALVSMLLTVIQMKIEEWLYNLIIRMKVDDDGDIWRIFYCRKNIKELLRAATW